jgi:transposase
LLDFELFYAYISYIIDFGEIMLKKQETKQSEIEMVILENLVPENHLLRKISKHIDFNFVRDKLSKFYCEDNGRPPVDPVVLFKIIFLGFLYGIRSERQLMREIEVNLAYRWFLGYKINEPVPHHSTLSFNRLHRFQNSDVFRELFDEIVFLAIRKKLVTGEVLYTDSTHLKANANKKKFEKRDVEGTAKHYLNELEEDVNKDRLRHGKKELKDKPKDPEIKEKRISTTDPDSGYMCRDFKEEGFAYLDHRTVDSKHNIITDVHVTPGNVHDSIPYIKRLDHQINRFGFDVQAVGLDAGYNTVAVCHGLKQRNIYGVLAYKAPSSDKDHIRKKYFTYDGERDIYICPEGYPLKYQNTGRDGYQQFVSDPEICSKCPRIAECTKDRNHRKLIARHVWEDDKIEIDKNRLTKEGIEIYKRRKETVERSFADAKQLHGYRYARYRGILSVTFQCIMTAICQNIKKIANLLDKYPKVRPETMVSGLSSDLSVLILSLYVLINSFLGQIAGVSNFFKKNECCLEIG